VGKDDGEVSAGLRSQVEERGLELHLRHLGTPGQLAFAVPVRGLDYWGVRLLRDGRLVAEGVGVNPDAAVEDALRAIKRT
jgi:hypothetical protein